MKKLKNAKFDYGLDFKNLEFRKSPGLYRIGLGEQGVLSVEPYKSEILPSWRFKTPEIARVSSEQLREKFYAYRNEGDFIGMDMTRKFIQMGVTRARRYANWSGGKKYTGKTDGNGKKITVTKGPEDQVKAESARIFGVVLKQVQEDEQYAEMAERHRETYERPSMLHDESQVQPKKKKIKIEDDEARSIPKTRSNTKLKADND